MKKTEKNSQLSFQDMGLAVADWIAKHKLQLTFAVSPIIALAIAAGAYEYFQSQSKLERIEELGKIDTAFMEELSEAKKKREEVQKKLDAIGTDNDQKKKDASPAEKELEEQLAQVKADHSKSLSSYLAFFESNNSHPEGWVAGLKAISIYLEDKKIDEVAPIAKKIIENSRKYQFYQIHVRMVYSGVLEDQEKFDEALEELDHILKLNVKSVVPQVLLAKGRIYMHQKKADEAAKSFDEILNNHAAAPEATSAKALKYLL